MRPERIQARPVGPRRMPRALGFPALFSLSGFGFRFGFASFLSRTLRKPGGVGGGHGSCTSFSPPLGTVSRRHGDSRNEVRLLCAQKPRSGQRAEGPRSRGAEFEPNGEPQTARFRPGERRGATANGPSHPLPPSFSQVTQATWFAVSGGEGGGSPGWAGHAVFLSGSREDPRRVCIGSHGQSGRHAPRLGGRATRGTLLTLSVPQFPLLSA